MVKRDCLLKLCTITSEEGYNIGVSLITDDYWDLVTVVTKKIAHASPMWGTACDVKICFAYKEIAKAYYNQQRD